MFNNAEMKGFVMPTDRQYRCRDENGKIVYRYPQEDNSVADQSAAASQPSTANEGVWYI